MSERSRTCWMSRLTGEKAKVAKRQDKRFTSRRYTEVLTSGLQWSRSAPLAPFHAAATSKLIICDIGVERHRNYQAHVSLTELNRSEHSPLFFRKIPQAVDIQLHNTGRCTTVTSRAGTLRVACELACSLQCSVSSNLVTLSSLTRPAACKRCCFGRLLRTFPSRASVLRSALQRKAAVDPRIPTVLQAFHEEGHLTLQHKEPDLIYTV